MPESNALCRIREGLEGVRQPCYDMASVMEAMHETAVTVAAEGGQVSVEFCPEEFGVVYKGLWETRTQAVRMKLADTASVRKVKHVHSTPHEIHELTELHHDLLNYEKYLIGDCLLAAAHTVYLPLFPPHQHSILTSSWQAVTTASSITTAFTTLTSFLQRFPLTLPPLVHAMGPSTSNAICALWITEEHGSKWPLIQDPLHVLSDWLTSRGYTVCSATAPNILGLINLAAAHGTKLLIRCDMNKVITPALQPYLNKAFIKGKKASFGLCFCDESNEVVTLDVCRRMGVVILQPCKGDMVDRFLSDTLEVVDPPLQEESVEIERAIHNCTVSVEEGFCKLLKLLSEEHEPAAVSVRTVLQHRRENLQKLKTKSESIKLRRTYHFPVAVRIFTLYMMYEEVLGRSPCSVFRSTLKTALRSHLVRPPTYAGSPEKLEEAIQALTAAALHTDKSLSTTSMAVNLRTTPQSHRLDAVTIAHNVTCSIVGHLGSRVDALCRCYGLFQKGHIPEEEWKAITLQHPAKKVDEVELTKSFKKHVVVIEAEITVLTRNEKDLEKYVGYVGRGLEVEKRWEMQKHETQELAMLCLWGGGPHCEQELIDKKGLTAYGSVLLEALDRLKDAIKEFKERVVGDVQDVLAQLKGECNKLREEAEQVFLEVQKDISDGHVYDLEHHATRVGVFKQRQGTLEAYQNTLSVSFLDTTPLRLLVEVLHDLNYTTDPPKLPVSDTLPPSNESLKLAKRLNQALRIEGTPSMIQSYLHPEEHYHNELVNRC